MGYLYQDSAILCAQNFAQNWLACAELSSIDQMAQNGRILHIFSNIATKFGTNYCRSQCKVVWCKNN